MNRHLATATILSAILVLSACDNGGSAVQTRDRSAPDIQSAYGSSVTEASSDTSPVAAAPETTVMTANRRETVDAKVTRLYERNGAAFGASSPEDFLTKVEAFTTRPPSGTDTVKRPNGDTLYYQASTNTFAVVDRNGVPRTMFKPDDGPAYWAQQKERAPTFGQRRTDP